MANEMTVVGSLKTGMRFDVETGTGHHVPLDAAEHNGGQNSAPQPMEMLLVGLAGCAAMDIISILRKKRQNITTYEVRIRGGRTEEYPKVFVEIAVEHIFTGHGINPEAVKRAIDLTEERYCGASAMLRKTASITHSFHIMEEKEDSSVDDKSESIEKR
jgi:putative redox protein